MGVDIDQYRARIGRSTGGRTTPRRNRPLRRFPNVSKCQSPETWALLWICVAVATVWMLCQTDHTSDGSESKMSPTLDTFCADGEHMGRAIGTLNANMSRLNTSRPIRTLSTSVIRYSDDIYGYASYTPLSSGDQTCHNFVAGIRIFKANICINPYHSPMHRCIATRFPGASPALPGP